LFCSFGLSALELELFRCFLFSLLLRFENERILLLEFFTLTSQCRVLLLQAIKLGMNGRYGRRQLLHFTRYRDRFNGSKYPGCKLCNSTSPRGHEWYGIEMHNPLGVALPYLEGDRESLPSGDRLVPGVHDPGAILWVHNLEPELPPNLLRRNADQLAELL
jgi:hypothetical protein